MTFFRNFYDLPKIRQILSRGTDFVLRVQFSVLGILKKYPFFYGN